MRTQAFRLAAIRDALIGQKHRAPFGGEVKNGHLQRRIACRYPRYRLRNAPPIWPGMAGCLSMSILTSLTLPLAPRTAFSSTGVSCLHGPHHSAQKSTSTGWRLDSSITSFTKPCVVVSLMTPSAVGAAPAISCSIVLFPDDAGPLGLAVFP